MSPVKHLVRFRGKLVEKASLTAKQRATLGARDKLRKARQKESNAKRPPGSGAKLGPMDTIAYPAAALTKKHLSKKATKSRVAAEKKFLSAVNKEKGRK